MDLSSLLALIDVTRISIAILAVAGTMLAVRLLSLAFVAISDTMSSRRIECDEDSLAHERDNERFRDE